MSVSGLQLDEIVIALRPRLQRSGVDRYDANIYAPPHLALPVTTSGDGKVADMPLRGVEHVKVDWSKYQRFLEWFHDGEKGAYQMRERLFEAVSPGLRAVLEQVADAPRRTRVWWSCESPEIEELPWELLLRAGDADVSFVRGTPGSPRALVPRRGPALRLAVVSQDPAEVSRLGLDQPLEGVEVAFVSGGMQVRRALSRAVSEGVELLHIVADGSMLPSWDALLEFGGGEQLSPSQLSADLRGSRVVALGLSEASGLGRDEHGPQVFRAFSHLPAAIDTNVVALLGPLHPSMKPFPIVYSELAATGSVEKAVRAARSAGRYHVPLSLYLRQRLGRELASSSSRRGAMMQAPQEVESHLDAVRQMMTELRAIENRYEGLKTPLSGSEAFRKQEEGIADLDAVLTPWTTLEDDER